NCLGVKPGSALQLVLTSAKLVAVALMLVLLFLLGDAAHRTLSTEILTSSVSVGAYSLAIGAGLFAYGGWHMVTYAPGEARNPARTIPRALMIGMAVVTGVYILLNAAYLYVLPLDEVARSTRVAADASERILGTRAAGAIAGLVIVSALGAL